MILEIMSKEKAVEYSFEQHNSSSAILSIDKTYAEFTFTEQYKFSDDENDLPSISNNLTNGIAAHCIVYFNDVEAGMPNCIKDDDANKIVIFVREVVGKVDKLIIHCEYGVSRSAGVAAAILKHFSGNDLLIWGNPRYQPNITCYRKVMAAFNEVIEEQELNEKITLNRSLGFKNNDKTESPTCFCLKMT